MSSTQIQSALGTDVIRAIEDTILFVQKYNRVQFIYEAQAKANRFEAATAIAYARTLIKVMGEAEMDQNAQDQFLSLETSMAQCLFEIPGQNTPRTETVMEFLLHVPGALAQDRWEVHLESLTT